MNVSRETHKADHYFDLSEVWFKDLFASDKPVWALLEKDFKERWIESKLKPNLKGIVQEGNLVLKDFPVNGGRIEAGAYIHGDQIELREGVIIESGDRKSVV